MSSRMGKVVCVTGASGYIGSWLVKLLLHRDYTIHAIVRDTADPKKTLHLQALDGAKDKLHLFKASLLEEGTFDAAIAGSDCVFQTASPFYHKSRTPRLMCAAQMDHCRWMLGFLLLFLFSVMFL